MRNFFFLSLALLPCLFYGKPSAYRTQLQKQYEQVCQHPSDINEHIPILAALARECSMVVEIGVRDIVSTWGLLQGLADSSGSERVYLGVDLQQPPERNLHVARKLADKNKIIFDFWVADDLYMDIPPADLLFIDSLHTYCHLMSELERFSPRVRKYIALHDTSGPWGEEEDVEYKGDYSEYPPHFDRTKRGLWAAVVDFLASHPDWVLKERHLNNNGLTVLQKRDTVLGAYGKPQDKQ